MRCEILHQRLAHAAIANLIQCSRKFVTSKNQLHYVRSDVQSVIDLPRRNAGKREYNAQYAKQRDAAGSQV